MATLHLELSGRLMAASIPLILLLGVIVFVVVIAVQRSGKQREGRGDGADLIAYLILALSMGVAGFALAELASTAFPGDAFVFDLASDLATSLSALVVSAPFAVYFWQRQARRRITYPGSTGWAIYLALIELTFLMAFVISTVSFIHGLLTDSSTSAWTGAVIFGAIVAFHEYAARVTPPQSDAGELRRVIGSAIGLVTAVVGATGLLAALLATLYETTGATAAFDRGLHPWMAMLIVGSPIWWYRWFRPWETKPSVPRLTWEVVVAFGSLSTALGAATAIAVQVVQFIVSETPPAGQHFDSIPLTLALILVGLPIWMLHRRPLAEEGGNPLWLYRYAMAALGLIAASSMAIALTIVTFDRSLIVGADAAAVITFAVVLIAGLAVWLVFEQTGFDTAAIVSWPRKLYTLGVGIVFGLVAAGALIATLFVLLRRLLGASDEGSLLQPTTVLVYTGLAAWYLLHGYFRERARAPERHPSVPFDVTIICSHPGTLAAKFPDRARLRVWYRGDDQGVITDEMADQIVAAVANRPSFVWVDGDGFRLTTRRPT